MTVSNHEREQLMELREAIAAARLEQREAIAARVQLQQEAAAMDERLAAQREWFEKRLAAQDARNMFFLDRLRAILASGGSNQEMLAEVEGLSADLAAGRIGVPPRNVN